MPLGLHVPGRPSAVDPTVGVPEIEGAVWLRQDPTIVLPALVLVTVA